MQKEIVNNPVMQDTIKNAYNNKIQLRSYPIPQPIMNYGFIPETWEQSIKLDENGLLVIFC